MIYSYTSFILHAGDAGVGRVDAGSTGNQAVAAGSCGRPLCGMLYTHDSEKHPALRLASQQHTHPCLPGCLVFSYTSMILRRSWYAQSFAVLAVCGVWYAYTLLVLNTTLWYEIFRLRERSYSCVPDILHEESAFY